MQAHCLAGHHLSPPLHLRRPVSAVAAPPRLRRNVAHSLPPEKAEVFRNLEGWASMNLLPLLKPVEKCWQPMDFLPDPAKSTDEFQHEVRALRERSGELPAEYFVVLIGDMITEEALPTYQTMINTLDSVRDETGASSSPWAVWTRAWTAEENRHGDLLSKYLYLSGRVDMKMVEKTVQYLIGAGMVIKQLCIIFINGFSLICFTSFALFCMQDPGTENNPYLGFIYTSFQERATFVSHGNTARLAKNYGDSVLAKICGTIAADEKRHETAYTRIVEKLIELDPDGALVSIENMMRKRITMPAHLMSDGCDPRLFEHFSAVAQRLGVYTAGDYADILEFLVGKWKLDSVEGLSAAGRHAQEFVCGLPARIRKMQERADERAKTVVPHLVKFSIMIQLMLGLFCAVGGVLIMSIGIMIQMMFGCLFHS